MFFEAGDAEWRSDGLYGSSYGPRRAMNAFSSRNCTELNFN